MSHHELTERSDPLPGVHRYAGYEEYSPEPYSRLEVPNGYVTLILSFGDPLDVSGARCTSFVAALHEHPAVTTFVGGQHGVQIDLSPLAARRLLNMPLHEVSSELVVGWEDIFGGDELLQRLADTAGWDERFALLDRELARRLDRQVPHEREVAWAFGRLVATEGRAPASELASELGWSPRRLIDRFRDGVGLPPKLTARILRFEAVVKRLGEGESLADIAYDAGYYDQPHMNRDFREFAHCSPGEYTTGNFVQDVPGTAG
jgi:AraC-like DNA-binding protein